MSEKTKMNRIRMLKKARRKRKQETAARFVVEEALRRGSTDNITVIIIWLDKETDDIE